MLFFLLVFEIMRRQGGQVAVIYDKRRFVYPNRTPPPLRWRCFEWWRLCLADEKYNKKSQQEYQDRLFEERKKVSTADKVKEEADFEILREAERICREEVPYFRDPDNSNALNDGKENDEGEIALRTGGSASTNTTTSTMTSKLSPDSPRVASEPRGCGKQPIFSLREPSTPLPNPPGPAADTDLSMTASDNDERHKPPPFSPTSLPYARGSFHGGL